MSADTQQDDVRPDEEQDAAQGGQVSETGRGGAAPDLDADAVPSEHGTPGDDEADV